MSDEQSGVFATEPAADETLTQEDGRFVATLCRICRRYKKDVLVGAGRPFHRSSTFCRCDDNRKTATMSAAYVANWT